MIGVAMYTAIKTLKEPGKSKSEMARLTNYCPHFLSSFDKPSKI